MGRLFIGTSGYNYKHWPGVFYPPGLPQSRWLEFYCRHFETVELNVTFYRLPARKTFEGWYKKTPADFVFAAKGSRFITHIKRMRDCFQPIKVYKENALGLGKKLAIVLWQLPLSSDMKAGCRRTVTIPLPLMASPFVSPSPLPIPEWNA